MNNNSSYTIFDELMQELENSLIHGSMQVDMNARQQEINLELMAVAHLQTTIASNVLVLASRILGLPVEIRDQIAGCLGMSCEELRKIVETGGEITPDAAMNTAVLCLSSVLRSMKHIALEGKNL